MRVDIWLSKTSQFAKRRDQLWLPSRNHQSKTWASLTWRMIPSTFLLSTIILDYRIRERTQKAIIFLFKNPENKVPTFWIFPKFRAIDFMVQNPIWAYWTLHSILPSTPEEALRRERRRGKKKWVCVLFSFYLAFSVFWVLCLDYVVRK